MSRNLGIAVLVLGVIVVLLQLTGKLAAWGFGDFKWAGYIAIVLGAIMVYAAVKQQQ